MVNSAEIDNINGFLLDEYKIHNFVIKFELHNPSRNQFTVEEEK